MNLISNTCIGDDILFGYCDIFLPYYRRNSKRFFNSKYFDKKRKNIKCSPIYLLHYPEKLTVKSLITLFESFDKKN